MADLQRNRQVLQGISHRENLRRNQTREVLQSLLDRSCSQAVLASRWADLYQRSLFVGQLASDELPRERAFP
jgi:hypothetical protein